MAVLIDVAAFSDRNRVPRIHFNVQKIETLETQMDFNISINEIFNKSHFLVSDLLFPGIFIITQPNASLAAYEY